ncbi:hypothetical protein L7F22_043705 [Adiantum nelumboides]|nr:hypothetical protein [Adiantum nelumboides]
MAAARMPQPPTAAAMMSPPYGGGAPAGGGQNGAPPGTLAPGTQIMVGPIVVTVQKYLSQGGFAHVYLVTTDKPVPMPISATSAPGATQSTTKGETLHVLKRMAVPDKESLASVRSEVEIHKQLRSHPNIVHFIEASATALRGGGYEIFILMEYCAGGGIIDLMNARLRTRLSEAEVLKIFGDVAAGLSVMHNLNPPLMHRDLKVENILLSPPPRSNPGVGPTYKLCDFGSSKALTSRTPAQTLDEVKLVEADLNKHTTLQYRAPEMVDVYQRRVIDEKADIWAMGVLLYKLCYYTTPFEENGGGPLAILNARYRFPHMPPYSQRLKDLIASMLQEQSTSRPSIDEILLRVHRMLGTQPPSSVLNKISAIKSGSAQASSASSRPDPNQISSKPKVAAAGGVTNDLIEVCQTEADRKRADEEELKKRSEAITPMRRGRPTKGAGGTPSSTATSAAAAKFEQAAAATLQPSSSSMRKSTSSFGNLNSQASSAQPRPLSPDKGSPLGFSDSFTPSKGMMKNGSSKTLIGDSSRPSSALDHSPALPGFDAANRLESARASPLPPPVSSSVPTGASNVSSLSNRFEKQGPIQPKPIKEDDTSSRFPSVEELDRRYPTDNIPAKPSPPTELKSPLSHGRSPISTSPNMPSSIPGLSNRAPVSAMADKYGAMASKRGSVPVQSKPLPPISGKPSGTSSVGNRWPHQQAQSSGTSSTPLAGDRLPPPSLPSRKHDWLQRNGSDAALDASKPQPRGKSERKTVEEDGDTSSGEDEMPPEDLDAPMNKRSSGTVPSTFSEAKQKALERQQDHISTKVSSTSVPGKVKTPDWIKSDSAKSPPAAIEQPNITGENVLNKSPIRTASASSAFENDISTQSVGILDQQKAIAPAWDEDDEEMHFLPQPTLHSTPSGRPISQIMPSQAKNAGRLIDFDEEVPLERSVKVDVAAQVPSSKQYADASTSPGRGLPEGDVELQPSIVPASEALPVLSPKPTPIGKPKEVGNLVSRFEDVRLNGDNRATSKPSPPVKPDHIAIRQSSTQDKVDLSSSAHREENVRPLRSPPAVASKPASLSSALSTPADQLPTKSSTMPPPSNSSTLPTLDRSSKPNLPSKSSTSASLLKPWEKEAIEKEQIEKFGSLRSRSPMKQNSENKDDVKKSQKTKGEAQDRFQGVSSLISQWQANASKGAPGWGTVGGGSVDDRSERHGLNKKDSKDEDELFSRSSTLSQRSGSSMMQGRLHSREV